MAEDIIEEKENEFYASLGTQKKEEKEIDRLEKLNQRLKTALQEREELMAKQEQLKARDKVGGQAEAGKPIKTEADLDREKIEAQADQIYGSLYDLKKRRR